MLRIMILSMCWFLKNIKKVIFWLPFGTVHKSLQEYILSPKLIPRFIPCMLSITRPGTAATTEG